MISFHEYLILSITRRPNARVLIFNTTGGRLGDQLLTRLSSVLDSRLKLLLSNETCGNAFDHVIFCREDPGSPGSEPDGKRVVKRLLLYMSNLGVKVDGHPLGHQRKLASVWSTLVGSSFPNQKVHTVSGSEEALKIVRGCTGEAAGGSVDILVTGSLILVVRLIQAAGLEGVALECFASP